MHKRYSKLALVIVLFVALAVSAVSAIAQGTEMNPEDYHLAWYVPAAHPYFEEVLTGVEAFEEETGIDVETQVGPDWEQNSQNERMEALAAQGFTHFSVYPAGASGANSLYEELTANGITIINFGASTLLPTTASFAVATDVKAAAMLATESLIEAMGGQGRILNVLEVLDDPNTILRREGIEEVVAEHPDVEIIQEVAGITNIEEAIQRVGDALSANINEVDGIITTGYTPSVAVAQLLTEYYDQGGDREIHAVTIDTDPEVVEAIENGIIDGTIAQNPFGHGYLSLMLLKLMAEGWVPAEDTYFVDAGAVFVTADNLETFADDLAEVTETIKENLTTLYLVAPES